MLKTIILLAGKRALGIDGTILFREQPTPVAPRNAAGAVAGARGSGGITGTPSAVPPTVGNSVVRCGPEAVRACTSAARISD